MKSSYEFNISLVRNLSAKKVLQLMIPVCQDLGISRISETNGYVDLEVSIVSATRAAIDFRQVSSTQGKGFDIKSAAVGALVEALERYCASHIDQRLKVYGGCGRDPDGNALNKMYLYNKSCHPEEWFLGTDLRTKKIAWVPMLEVAFPYQKSPSDPILINPHTSGLAAGASIEEASLYALLEIYERHYTSLFYRNVRKKNTGQFIDLDSIPDSRCKKLIEDMRTQGYELLIFRLGGFLPTYYVATLDTRYLAPRFMIAGTGTGLSEFDALESALLECIQGLVTALAGGREDLERSRSKYNSKSCSGRNIFYEVLNVLQSQNEEGVFSPMNPQIMTCDSAWDEIFPLLVQKITCPLVLCDLTRNEFPLSVVKLVAPSLNDWIVNPYRGRVC